MAVGAEVRPLVFLLYLRLPLAPGGRPSLRSPAETDARNTPQIGVISLLVTWLGGLCPPGGSRLLLDPSPLLAFWVLRLMWYGDLPGTGVGGEGYCYCWVNYAISVLVHIPERGMLVFVTRMGTDTVAAPQVSTLTVSVVGRALSPWWGQTPPRLFPPIFGASVTLPLDFFSSLPGTRSGEVGSLISGGGCLVIRVVTRRLLQGFSYTILPLNGYSR